MMAIAELETAAQVLLAPPNLVNPSQRHAAESVFLEFRKSKSPFQLCKQILETSHVDYVLFEAAGLLKEGLIREWTSLQLDEIKGLRSYLLQYVINHPSLSSFVRERIVQVMAIIIKRLSVDDLGDDRREVLVEVQQLITGGNMQMQMIGCSILSSMLQEYATTVKSSDVGLPWEVHFKAKKNFELTDLRSIFEFCVAALKELTPTLTLPLAQERHNLILRLSTLAESVLSWGFISINLPKKLISIFEADQYPSLRPGAPWKDTMLDPQIPILFFELHLKVRQDPELCQHTLNCLIQLSSLNGGVMTKKEDRVAYLANYVTHFLNMLASFQSIEPMEALGCSNIIRKIMLFFPPAILTNLPQQLLEAYLKQMTQLTCHFMKAATQKNKVDSDLTSMYTEAFEHMLEAWVSVLHESQSFPAGFCQQSAVQIFNTYVQCNLAPPDGMREILTDDDDDFDDNEEPDRVRFKETLATIGALGREAPSHSINLMMQLLENRLTRLHGQMQRIISQGGNSMDNVLSDLYEDIHWILLIAGNILTLDTDGETALIPSEIMRYSLEKSPEVSVESTLRVLASPSQPSSEIPGHESSDPVIKLVGSIFRVAEIEKRAVEAGVASLLSPEVSSTLMWYLRRWALTYLLVQECYYSEISLALVTAFGQNTEGAAWTMGFLFDKIISNLTHLNSEPKLVQDTIGLLVALADTKEKGRQALKSEALVNLVNLQSSHQIDLFPSDAKRGMSKALVLIGSACEDQASKEQYWEKVLKPIGDRYNSIITRSDLKKIYNDEKIRQPILSTLEALIGVMQGIQMTTVQQLFSFLQPILASMVDLLSLFHNYPNIVELILELFCEAAKRCLCYLNQSDSRVLYQHSVSIIRMYALHNQGKRSIEKESEEEQYRDILLLMELLTNLLSKDFIDLAPQDPNPQGEDGLTAADVCLFGLNIIMPMMTVELLKFPSLCLQYFKTITFVCELYPDKICSLNPDLQTNLVASLELGLTSLGVDTIYSLCCDFVQVLCSYILRYQARDNPIYEALRPFLKLMLDLILSQRVNSELMPNASSTLYLLMCNYQDTYRELVQMLINSQSDPVNRQRLVDALQELTKNLPMTGDRVNRVKFRENFEKFIVDVRGFLLVK